MHDVLVALHAAQQAFYAGEADATAFDGLLADDIEWHVPGANAIAGDYHGRAEVLDYFARRRDRARSSFRMHPGEVLTGDGDHIAVLTDGTATIDGVERRWSTVGLYRLCDNRVQAVWLLPLDARAFDDYWR